MHYESAAWKDKMKHVTDVKVPLHLRHMYVNCAVSLFSVIYNIQASSVFPLMKTGFLTKDYKNFHSPPI